MKQSRQLQMLQSKRRANLRRIIGKHGTNADLARILGYKTASFVTQMLSPKRKPRRNITERTARNIENKLQLTPRSLDR